MGLPARRMSSRDKQLMPASESDVPGDMQLMPASESDVPGDIQRMGAVGANGIGNRAHAPEKREVRAESVRLGD